MRVRKGITEEGYNPFVLTRMAKTVKNGLVNEFPVLRKECDGFVWRDQVSDSNKVSLKVRAKIRVKVRDKVRIKVKVKVKVRVSVLIR
jgi:DNA-directed RNA polymerase subunit E'/Rpb7